MASQGGEKKGRGPMGTQKKCGASNGGPPHVQAGQPQRRGTGGTKGGEQRRAKEVCAWMGVAVSVCKGGEER